MRKLKHTVLHNLNYRLRHYFEWWKVNLWKLDIANFVNNEGPVAIELDNARKEKLAL